MPNVIYGENCSVGEYAVAESDVIIGNNVELGHLVVLRSGTRIGNDVVIKDGVKTDGLCIIGDNVIICQNSVICEGSIVNDNAIVGPSSVIGYNAFGENKRTIINNGQIIPAGSMILSGYREKEDVPGRNFSKLDMARYFPILEDDNEKPI